MTQRKLELTRPLVAFDLETTGLDVNLDRIIEISCIKIGADGSREVLTRRINPEMPISPQATQVHGIRDTDVAHEPTFAMLQDELYRFLAGCDLTGFNVQQFDLPLLAKEFERVGRAFPEPAVRVIDSWRIFLKKEPRDLTAAFRTYCGKELEHAHSAEADAAAAADILMAQVARYSDLPTGITDLESYCSPNRSDWLDRTGKLLWVEGEAVLGFGKYRGHALRSLAQRDPGYLRWMAEGSTFADDVAEVARRALEGEFPERSPGSVAPPNGPATVVRALPSSPRRLPSTDLTGHVCGADSPEAHATVAIARRARA